MSHGTDTAVPTTPNPSESSPVTRVPPELLYEIFERVPPWPRLIGLDTVDHAPWRLGHICKSWREIALACPTIWNTLTIIHGEGSEESFPRTMVETQLARTSLGAPLHIHFKWCREEGKPVVPLEENSVWDLFLPLSDRWESLRIQCPNTATGRVLLDLLKATKCRLSQLAHLEFLVDNGQLSDNGWDAFATAPRLSEVFLTDILYERYSPGFPIPWAQIKHYRGVPSGAEQLDILQKTPKLVECTIGYDDSDLTHGTTMVVLPLLRRLSVEGASILDHITAPALQLLLADQVGALTPSTNLLSFVRRSSCRLTTLSLAGGLFLGGLIPLLQACPALEILLLDGRAAPDFPHTASSFFTAMHQSESICPNLRSFTLGWRKTRPAAPAEPNPWSPLFRMIESRSGRLLSVTLFTSHRSTQSIPPGLNDGIEALRARESGLDIRYVDVRTGQDIDDGLRP
ncbi:hypothetical protein FB45DRAFT_1012035 [Roridomyces roridus]|uniref:F-box domain-containing protein n=1 Tax=Roridomyces roridus TaxID=1738132 RepID=A0AAD7F727_9AGAR|nr:hypothetical protein FB45DRAFT_1012035 [Roridomyces roridus]